MVGVSEEQQRQFFKDGYIIIKNVVPLEQITKATRLINWQLGKGCTEEEMEKAAVSSYCRSLLTNTEILSLFNQSPARNLAESLIDSSVTASHCQIALRFPGYLCCEKTFTPLPFWANHWHIDGFHVKVTNLLAFSQLSCG